MRHFRFVGTACLVLCLAACSGDTGKKGGKDGKSGDKKEASNAEKLVGTWELVKSESNAPPGATIEFTKDGEIKMTVKATDKASAAEGTYKVGTYKVDGDKITTTTKAGGTEKAETATIKTLTDTKLVTEDEKGKTTEFKKK